MLRNEEKANPRVQQQIIQQIVTPIASKYGHIVDRGTAPNFISDWLQRGWNKKNATAIVTSTNRDSLSGNHNHGANVSSGKFPIVSSSNMRCDLQENDYSDDILRN